jgi:hypothetical protein
MLLIGQAPLGQSGLVDVYCRMMRGQEVGEIGI